MEGNVVDTTFEVVGRTADRSPSDSTRSLGRRCAEWFDHWLGLPQGKLGGYYKTFQKEGLKLRTKADGSTHTIVWAESPPVVKSGK